MVIANWSVPSAHGLISGRWFFVAAFRHKRLLHLVFILLAAAEAQKGELKHKNLPKPNPNPPKWNQKAVKKQKPNKKKKRNSANEKLHLPVGRIGVKGGVGVGGTYLHMLGEI